jgi:hypothetical protein
VTGRALTEAEMALAQPVFGRSIDFARVRLILTGVLEYRTVGNNIRVPPDFSVGDQQMAETLIHELTHVWQYQHGGTAYLSHSLQTQIAASAGQGSRNFAYAYTLGAESTFFDFTPEQQAEIVENYFAMLRDQGQVTGPSAAYRSFHSNHFGAGGGKTRLTAAERSAEIAAELPLHQAVIGQLQSALPAAESAILLQRASEVIGNTPLDRSLDTPPDRQLTPVKPLISVEF